MNEIFLRLAQAAKNKGATGNSDIGRLLNESPQVVTNWSSRGVPAKKIFEIADKLGVSPDWLQTGKESRQHSNVGNLVAGIVAWEHEDDLNGGDYVFIPRYDVHVSAGNGIVVWDENRKEQPQAFRLSFIQLTGLNPASLRVIYCRGDSMQPRIFDGDSLTVDMGQASIIDGKTYIVRIGDEIFCKVLRKLPLGGVSVISLNPEYPTMTVSIDEADKFDVIARVVQISSMGGL